VNAAAERQCGCLRRRHAHRDLAIFGEHYCAVLGPELNERVGRAVFGADLETAGAAGEIDKRPFGGLIREREAGALLNRDVVQPLPTRAISA
jgi:hypothetical protein